MSQGFECAGERTYGVTGLVLHLLWPGLGIQTVCGYRPVGAWPRKHASAWRDGIYPKCAKCWERFQGYLTSIAVQVQPDPELTPSQTPHRGGPGPLSREGHKQRHVHLDRTLRELLDDYLLNRPGNNPFSSTIRVLEQWSLEQSVNPTEVSL